MIDRLLRFLGLRKEKEAVLKYCGGVRTRHGHHEPKRWSTPSTTEMRIVRKSVERVMPSDIIEPSASVKPHRDAVSKHKRLQAKWRLLVGRLERHGTVFIGRNEYYGSLRGIDIILHAKKDLRRLGYDVSIRTKGRDGYITLK